MFNPDVRYAASVVLPPAGAAVIATAIKHQKHVPTQMASDALAAVVPVVAVQVIAHVTKSYTHQSTQIHSWAKKITREWAPYVCTAASIAGVVAWNCLKKS